MIAYLSWIAWFDRQFLSMLRDPWFWNTILFWWLMTFERRWRREAQKQRDYWHKEVTWWMEQCERWTQMHAPMVSAFKAGEPKPPHHCHEKCDVDGLHPCHAAGCRMRQQKEVS